MFLIEWAKIAESKRKLVKAILSTPIIINELYTKTLPIL